MNWQTIAVTVIIAFAVVYIARRALSRVRSFMASKSSCVESGCGSCADSQQKISAPKTFVQISRSHPGAGRKLQ